MSKRDELIDVEVQFAYSTPGAWMVVNAYKQMVSLPRSQIDMPDEPNEGAMVSLQVPTWLVESKELV
jgi:hypothetical protein